MTDHESIRALNEEGRQLWDAKAAFWDDLHGDEGNAFHQRLVAPALEGLLELQPGERVLDVACGNGVVARRLAELGAQVTATDFSAALIAAAQARGQASGHAIDYRVVDATDEAALGALGEAVFDAVVCTMALMDMPTIAPLFRAVSRLLTPAGRFVFVTAHPAFNSNNPGFFTEVEDHDGGMIVRRGLKITAYLDVPPVKAAGAANEPNPHYYYHRPLGELIGTATDAGLVLDGIREVAFTPEDFRVDREPSWMNMPQIPPVMAGRLRRYTVPT